MTPRVTAEARDNERCGAGFLLFTLVFGQARESGAARLSFAPPPVLVGSSSSTARSPTDCCRRTTSPPIVPASGREPHRTIVVAMSHQVLTAAVAAPHHLRRIAAAGPPPRGYAPPSPPIMLHPPPSSWACSIRCTRRSTTIDLGKQLTVGPGQFVGPDSASRCLASHCRSVVTRPSRRVSVTAGLHPRHHSSRLTSAVQRYLDVQLYLNLAM